jgi:ferredoxin
VNTWSAPRVKIDPDLCQGHGRCTLLCPEAFDSDENGHGVVRSVDVTPDLEQAVVAAVRSCPEQAISLE